MSHPAPALSLGTEPHSVQNARRWVVDACTDIGRLDVLECAEVGVSELVTNALLHADAPIQVRLRGTAQHPRVEVRDASTSVPVLSSTALPASDDDLDGLLLTFGRGLSIVSRAAEAWGVEIEDDGKVVWFSPASDLSDEVGPEPQITYVSSPSTREAVETDVDEVFLPRLPLRLVVAFQHHVNELRREMRLLSLGDDSSSTLPADLADLFEWAETTLEFAFDSHVLGDAQHQGVDVIDLHLRIPRGSSARVARFRAMLDLTDEYCRAEKLLVIARTNEQRAFQNWLLDEITHQAAGQPSTTWSDRTSLDGRHSSAS